ncbi:MAG: hypothetical protein Fur002_09170 [Anaerolineales bacterium]
MPPLTGQTLLNQYRLQAFIASTPLGDLYRAVDVRSEALFALTILPKSIYENSEALRELEAQAGALKNIRQTNLTPYLGVYQTPALAFLLEAWVDGPSLRDLFAAKTPLGVEEALIIANAVGAALDALHKKNYLHANLAPELIRINKKGEIFLSGIGAAQKENSIKKRAGKYLPLYDAPEVFNGQELSAAADMYALAALTYQMLTAAWLNGSEAPKTASLLRRAHLAQTPPAPAALNANLPDNLSRMILWGLRKKPEERFQNATELLSALNLAAKISPPPTLTRESDSVSAKILSGWEFLPQPKTASVAQDHAPLEERLATLQNIRPKKAAARSAIIPIFILILLGGFTSFFWLVRPAPEQEAQPTATVTFTPFAADYTPPPSVTPSPRPTDEHGGRIVFTCTRGDYNQICMVNRDGSGYAQLTDMDASNYYPIFTNAADGLLFASNRNGTFDLYLLAFEKKELLQLTRSVGNVVSPDYSPDGRQILFANRVGDSPTALWVMNADGVNPHVLYQGAGDIVAAAWSPDGEKIAYAMSVGVPLEYEIFIMEANGKNHARISQGLRGIGGSLDWSPDGSHLLIYAGAYADKNIFKLDAQSGAFVQLTNSGNNAGASYSPDGRYIVFNSLRNNDQADLFIMRADGSNETQLTNDPEPEWGAKWAE